VIALYRLELLAMGQQQIEQISRRPVRGLQPGRQQQAKERVDGFVGELLAVDLRGHQIADDVFGRVRPALFDLLQEIVFQRRGRLESTLELDGVADQLDGALTEPRQIFLRQAQQLRDDAGRELEREVFDQIGLAGVDELVDQCVDDGPNDLRFPSQQ